ncbi:MAG: hydrogenase maturation nickel metallochaperone HypA [Bacillota bacterium]|jgi:hydrogenase nickel incorporation protein HypA/HybF
MHEYPITQQIIKIAENHAREAGAEKVKAVNLVVGDYSGFIGDSIQMYFDIISEGTLCEGADVRVKRVKPKLRCESCGTYFERKLFSFECPACGGEGRPTEIGKEFYIDSIEVEK